MYLPRPFRQDDESEVRRLLATHPLAELVCWTGHDLVASPLPLLLDLAPGEHGALLGHVARANDLWRTLDPEVEALAVFRGPDAYVSPSLYPSKATDGKVVPTWNYATVHVRGRVVVHDDAAWKLDLVRRLTDAHETGRGVPWSVADAPADFVAAQLGAIVGLELRITSITAKWKLSQNRPLADTEGVVAGLAAGTGRDSETAALMRDTAAGRLGGSG